MITSEASDIERVFSECKKRGVTLFLENGKIGYKPSARMTKGLLYNIGQNKAGIMVMLAKGDQPNPQRDILDLLNEEEQAQSSLYPDLTPEEDDLRTLLIAISEAGLTLRVPPGDEAKLWVSPSEGVTPELATSIRKHKAEIVSAMQFDEYRKTEKLQNTGQVLDLWREWKDLKRG